jgi:hypothetical protein
MAPGPRARAVRAAVVSAALCVVLWPAAVLLAPAAPAAGVGGSGWAQPAASPSACTAQWPYRHCLRYSYTGTDQVFTVPGSVTSIMVLEWGAGGGGADVGLPQYGAGAGGFTAGQVAVRPGDDFTVAVGQGGYVSGTGFDQTVYGGGGFGGNGAVMGASGGGMSALWSAGYGTSPVLIAGGGGGAAPGSQTARSGGRYPGVVGGGNGGGLSGGSDGTPYSGQGGTQYGPGEPGGPGAPCGSSGLGGTAPTAGQLYYGGNGAGSDPAPAGDGATAEGGGGGGGGYYGGGGGRCAVYASGPPDGAGGGGSGYIGAAAVTHAYSIAGTGAVEAGLDRGAPPARAAVRSPFYRSGIGWGGGQSGAGSGGNGQLVLEWGHDRHPRPKATPVPGPAPAATPTVAASPAPRRPMLPDTGFPFALAGMAVLILAGLGAAARRAGRGRQRP